MSPLHYQPFYRRHLPHIQPPGAVLFVTFRLAGSIPLEKLRQFSDEAEQQEALLNRIADPAERARQAYLLKRKFFGKWDAVLDAGSSGPRWLREPRVAGLVCDSLRQRDGDVYELQAFCVMPNHVHLVFQPLERKNGGHYSMATILHSVKRFTARQANEVLNRQGSFWQHESYDHVVRNDGELRRVVNYVLNNPVSAGLVNCREDWEWSYSQWGKEQG